MKLIIAVLILGLCLQSNAMDGAFITSNEYQCISDTMQAMNSDIFYNLTPTEIDEMLKIVDITEHTQAVIAARACGVK